MLLYFNYEASITLILKTNEKEIILILKTNEKENITDSSYSYTCKNPKQSIDKPTLECITKVKCNYTIIISLYIIYNNYM